MCVCVCVCVIVDDTASPAQVRSAARAVNLARQRVALAQDLSAAVKAAKRAVIREALRRQGDKAKNNETDDSAWGVDDDDDDDDDGVGSGFSAPDFEDNEYSARRVGVMWDWGAGGARQAFTMRRMDVQLDGHSCW